MKTFIFEDDSYKKCIYAMNEWLQDMKIKIDVEKLIIHSICVEKYSKGWRLTIIYHELT